MCIARYNEMFVDQEGVCAICGNPEAGKGRKNLCVDHNHETGNVRALLCNRCNLALRAIERFEFFQEAQEYLEIYR